MHRFSANMTPIFLGLLIFSVIVAFGLLYSLVFDGKSPQLKKTEVTIGKNVFDVEVASTTLARARGLSGRDGLGEKEGLLFLFDSPGNYGFWMKDMKFPIDIIWIKGDRVAGFSENAAPEPGAPLWKLKLYYPPKPVDKVLEVNAGVVKKYGIGAGDAVRIEYPGGR